MVGAPHAVAAEADAQQSPHGPGKDGVAVVIDDDGADQHRPHPYGPGGLEVRSGIQQRGA